MTLTTLGNRLILLVISAAILAGATIWRASQRARAAEAAFPPTGQFVTVDGLRIHAVVEGNGPDLVLIHGASGSARDMAFGFLPELAKTYRVIAFDRPGFGWSEAGETGQSLAAQAKVLQHAAAALGANTPVVMGHSYGGSVALAWALDAPDSVAALVTLSAPSHPWNTPLDRLYQITTLPVLGPVAIALISAWVPQGAVDTAVEEIFEPQIAPSGYVEHFGADMTLRRPTFALNAHQRAGLLDEIRAMVPRYAALSLPIESVHGTADTIVFDQIHAKILAQDAPDVMLTALPGIGHMPHHVARPEVIAAIHRAFARAKAAGRLR